MSRSIIRPAIQAWFAPPNVAGLNSVFIAEPKVTDPQGNIFPLGAAAVGVYSGATAYVHLEGDREYRRALGGATSGKKKFEVDAALVITFQSTQPTSEQAVVDNDTMIDAIKARLRADRTLGGTVFQAGEGDTLGAPDIEVLGDLPIVDGEMTIIRSVIRFKVILFVTT